MGKICNLPFLEEVEKSWFCWYCFSFNYLSLLKLSTVVFIHFLPLPSSFSLSLWGRVFHSPRLAQNLPCPKEWSWSCGLPAFASRGLALSSVPSCLVYLVQGTEPRYSCMRGKHSTNGLNLLSPCVASRTNPVLKTGISLFGVCFPLVSLLGLLSDVWAESCRWTCYPFNDCRICVICCSLSFFLFLFLLWGLGIKPWGWCMLA